MDTKINLIVTACGKSSLVEIKSSPSLACESYYKKKTNDKDVKCMFKENMTYQLSTRLPTQVLDSSSPRNPNKYVSVTMVFWVPVTEKQSKLKEKCQRKSPCSRQAEAKAGFILVSFPVLTLLVMAWQKERGIVPNASPLSSGGNSNFFCSFSGYIEKHQVKNVGMLWWGAIA